MEYPGNTLTFVIFAVMFMLFYSIVVLKNPYLSFFATTLTVVVTYYLFLRFKKVKEAGRTSKEGIERLEASFTQGEKKDFEVPNDRIYYIHKRPRSLKYLKRTADIGQIINDLKVLDIYDNALYDKIVTYTEYFLKVHYKMMLGKYDFDTYFPVLKDIRQELLNSMASMAHNLPRVSRIVDIPNIDDYTQRRITHMQAKTYRYIKIVHRKFAILRPNRKDLTYQAPYENDISDDPHYHLF